MYSWPAWGRGGTDRGAALSVIEKIPTWSALLILCLYYYCLSSSFFVLTTASELLEHESFACLGELV